MPILEDIRKAVSASKRAHRDIARAAKMHPVTLSKFLHGKVSLSAEAAERLSKALGMTLKLTKRVPRPK